MQKYLLAILLMLLATPRIHAENPVMLDFSKSDNFIDTYVQALAGGSYMIENYKSCYPEITDLNTSMRPAYGAGVGARFNLRKFLGLGTELNLTFNAFNMDMAVVGEKKQSVSNVFQRNSYYKLDIPVYVTFIFNLSGIIKWNVDGGMYYAYGLGGKQKNTIYDTRSNNLGQLMMSMTPYNADFYKDNRGFINTYNRSDIGMHLATGLTFSNHLRVGIMTHIGFKNLANSTGLIKPTSRTLNFMATVGWQF